jgi:penicillin G amidase
VTSRPLRAAGSIRHAYERFAGLTGLLACLLRHAPRRSRALTVEGRLAMLPQTGLPVEKPVTIVWDRYQVPFIEADTDNDLAVALGVVHAHLRLGQLELMRRVAQGRVAELIGSSAVAVDHLLRALDFARAVPAILAGLPASTRLWLEAFVRGVNHCLDRARPLPVEFKLFDLRPEPWTVADVLTLGRLVSADVNWILWFQLLRFRGDADWPRLWHRLASADSLACWTGDDAKVLPLTAGLRCGSNSFAVAASRTATGAALLASDPHLSLILPNAWLLAAFRSPSLHAAGMMIPGLPFIALGRNPWIAWGGTSLHAASSDLVAVPADDMAHLVEREVRVAVRWGSDRRLRLRESRWGPIVTDIPLIAAKAETAALRWMGHRPSDETSAILAVNRSRNWDEFRAALAGFAVPGQTMTYADTSGHVGRLMAVHLPCRVAPVSEDMTVPAGSDDGWGTTITGAELPSILDPPEGFVASANERPQSGGQVVGRHFSPPDRRRRLDNLLSAPESISMETAARIQRDVQLAPALAQCGQLLAWLDVPAMGHLDARTRRLVDDLATWDGCYEATSRGALGFEAVCHHLARALVPDRRRAAYGAAWGTRRLIWDDILSADPRRRQQASRHALRKAAHAIRRGETWGDRHRLRLGHPLALAPLLGRRWRFVDLPADGSRDTLMKTAHALTDRRHGARYGSVARQVCDLSDLDHSRFVLLGGQDGWHGSTTSLDQVPLWQRGEYITLPLRPETARATFPFRTILRP